MTKIANPDRLNRRLTPSEWAYAVDQYELGYQSGRSIAHGLGISKQAMSRGLIKRGAIKGARAHETVRELNKILDERDRLKRQATAKLWEQATVQLNAMRKFMRDFAIALGEPGYASVLLSKDMMCMNPKTDRDGAENAGKEAVRESVAPVQPGEDFYAQDEEALAEAA